MMALSRSAFLIAVLLLAPACVSPYTTSRKMMSDATRLLSMGEELDAIEQARAAVAWVPFEDPDPLLTVLGDEALSQAF